ncbi:MAG: RNA 2',3'-cyclic phosphodiesterase [Legionella sp.]|jgi:2'-5' RNA ligase
MNNIRAFFAIMPPTTMLMQLSKIVRNISQVIPEHHLRLSKTEHLHSTLQFIAHVRLQDIKPLSEQVADALKNIPAFELELGALEWFPNSCHPKILSLQVGPYEILKNLSDTLGQVLSRFNYPLEARPFRPHLTLARLKNVDSSAVQLEKIPLVAMHPALISEVHLMESKPDNGTTYYKSLAKFSLFG